MSALPPPHEPRTLIDDLLAEQQRLTAVERFARSHERDELPAQARYYRELIPLAKPQPGEQYAFAVDLDKCTGCKACVSACHSLNGLDEDEIWRNVGSIHGGSRTEPYQQTVTTACHHCVEPGCLQGCPVMAYEKDAETGIVRHLDDQCIGCEYCLLKCPYDVPKYSKWRGIVRKCDMCYQRLAANEAPACVQACPNEAITIRVADVAATRASSQPGVRLLPGAFDSSYTLPTTTYTTRKTVPANAQPGDAHRLRLDQPHWPLIWMLLLSQLSAGLQVAVPVVISPKFTAVLAVTAFVVLQAGLILSVFHLGKPLKAWRFFLGLRTSWMSREILAFGLFAGASGAVATGAVAALWFPQLHPYLHPGGNCAAVFALGAIFCSAMIYIDTHRPFWSARLTFGRFFGTTLSLGSAATAALACWLHMPRADPLCVASIVLGILHTGFDFSAFHRSLEDDTSPSHRSARTVKQLLRRVLDLRACGFLAFATAGLLAPFLQDTPRAIAATMAFAGLFVAAIAERYCFFTAVDAPRMPGGIAA
jgi:Fe-S-cluster-containing dehydrogenase component/DMSO reductase anchor subunit